MIAPYLSERISEMHILAIIEDEVGFHDSSASAKSVAMAKLHGAAWLHDDPECTPLENYVKIGMSAVELISTSAEIAIDSIREEIEELEIEQSQEYSDEDEDGKYSRKIRFLYDVIEWIEAISYAADNVDTVDMTLTIINDWADRNGIDLVPAEADE